MPDAAGQILVVDDDDTVRRFFNRVLSRAGYDVAEAVNGRDGLARIDDELPAVVVLDNRMPEMSGLDVLRRLRAQAHTRTLPVILVTGQGEVEERVEGLGAGADDYVTKPVHPQDLVARVRAQLRGQAAWREAIERQWAERASVAESLGRLAGSAGSAGQLADRVCKVLKMLPSVDTAAVLCFDGNTVTMLAQSGGAAREPGTALPRALGLMVQRRAREGPWTDELSLPRLGTDRRPHSALSAFAPLVSRGKTFGVLALGFDPTRAESALVAPALATAIDLAPAVASVLGPVSAGDESSRPLVERVIAEGAFRTVFQPVVELATRRVVGYEALTRFDDGTRPDLRFEQAAASGLAIELERAALQRAVAAAKRLPSDLWLSVNASSALLLEREALVAAHADADHSLVVELTEREPVDDYEALTDALRVVPDVLLAVDDAGAGYASLRHILTLHPAFIKLDITWVRDLDADPARQALVAGISHFGNVTNCSVVAEGVETEAEACALLDLGVELGQGFLFGRPEPAEVHTARTS